MCYTNLYSLYGELLIIDKQSLVWIYFALRDPYTAPTKVKINKGFFNGWISNGIIAPIAEPTNAPM